MPIVNEVVDEIEKADEVKIDVEENVGLVNEVEVEKVNDESLALAVTGRVANSDDRIMQQAIGLYGEALRTINRNCNELRRLKRSPSVESDTEIQTLHQVAQNEEIARKLENYDERRNKPKRVHEIM